ncbi:hypothetical protein BU23DRAFT_569387 [Bimuria novae-zelandiae CBS 107.79]|uniref:Uncharacterized protein n=1 Tax=Bimuria novae-zelandiae CBS 107.79 TaxID=1447943 RepID=A0A6A5V814_9PLEO|nr:hypothetical protein BU23DRAFT_569387 [Bimuria novae-zelandiae CBS 107.79]
MAQYNGYENLPSARHDGQVISGAHRSPPTFLLTSGHAPCSYNNAYPAATGNAHRVKMRDEKLIGKPEVQLTGEYLHKAQMAQVESTWEILGRLVLKSKPLMLEPLTLERIMDTQVMARRLWGIPLKIITLNVTPLKPTLLRLSRLRLFPLSLWGSKLPATKLSASRLRAARSCTTTLYRETARTCESLYGYCIHGKEHAYL